MIPNRVPILLPSVPDRNALLPYLGRIEQSLHYTNFGPLNRELELRLGRLFGEHASREAHVRTVSSATLGLELALGALDLPAKSRVVVPALTFVATMTAVIRAGHVPVVADVDPHTWLLTPGIAAAAAETTGAQAALAVSTFGRAQDTRAWSAFQKATGVRVLVDAAGAFGTQQAEAPDVPVVFSMHATKSLTAGEGGFVVSGRKAFAERIARNSNFGINLDPAATTPVGYLSSCGTNAKLSEFHAAVALASLDGWDAQAASRRRLYQQYRALLEAASGNAFAWQAGEAPAAPTILCVRAGSPGHRDRLEAACRRAGIGTRRWYQPLLHRHAPGIGTIVSLPVPEAERIAGDLVGLPFFAAMSDAQVDLVVDTVRGARSSPPQSTETDILEIT